MSDKINTNNKITYLFRNKRSGYSIHKVFSPLVASNLEADICEVPDHLAGVSNILRNLMYVRKSVNRKSVVHMTGGPHYLLLAVPFCKNVLTVHDLVLLHNNTGLKRMLFRLLWFVLPFMCARKITCISNTVRDELLTEFNLQREKVVKVYNPVDPSFKFTEKAFNLDKPRILHIGTAWNKNVVKTIEALDNINCTLVIVGPTTADIEQAKENSKVEIEMMQYLSDDELRQQYEQADIISFPSIFEGFGMPIIEGQAVGRPVLTSNVEPMKEVAGEGACLVNPHDVESIRKGFVKIIEDADYRNELVRQGTENVVRFNLENIKSQFNKIYKEL